MHKKEEFIELIGYDHSDKIVTMRYIFQLSDIYTYNVFESTGNSSFLTSSIITTKGKQEGKLSVSVNSHDNVL